MTVRTTEPYNCHSANTLLPPQLQAEEHRLEELKLLNIRGVTDALRSQILALWEKCFYSSEQRQDFPAFFRGGSSLSPMPPK